MAKDLLKAKEERELRIVEATFQIEDPLFKPRTKKRGRKLFFKHFLFLSVIINFYLRIKLSKSAISVGN